MSDWAHTRPLRSYAGHVERERVLEHQIPGRPDAYVRIDAMKLNGYEETRFEIEAHWVGEKLPGTPDARGVVSASDVYLVNELELAKHIAGKARQVLSRGKIPDLRQLAKRAKS